MSVMDTDHRAIPGVGNSRPGESAGQRTKAKSANAFRTISEVSDQLDIAPHVLRFWETKFTQVRPLKRGGGRRYYRPEDIVLLSRIRKLLHDDGYTIKGVQKLLGEGRFDPTGMGGAMRSIAKPAARSVPELPEPVVSTDQTDAVAVAFTSAENLPSPEREPVDVAIPAIADQPVQETRGATAPEQPAVTGRLGVQTRDDALRDVLDLLIELRAAIPT